MNELLEKKTEEELFWVDVLDLKTGRVVRDTACGNQTAYLHAFQWAENNWSCDCNREIAFDEDSETDFCLLHHRYVAIASNNPDFDYRWWNGGYLTIHCYPGALKLCEHSGDEFTIWTRGEYDGYFCLKCKKVLE